MAGIVGATGPLLIQYLVDVADWLSGRLLRDFGVDVAKTLSSSAEWFATFGTATGGPTVPIVLGFVAALLTILAALLVFLELLLRANAIYLIAALIPVIYAVRIWPAAKAVARHTTEVLLAVIFAQPVVALAISMGAAAGGALEGIGDAAVKDFGQALAGAVFLLLGAMCPWGMLALVPGVERAVAAHRQRAAVTGGARSGIQVAYTGTYLGRLAAAGRSAAWRRRREEAAAAGGHRRRATGRGCGGGRPGRGPGGAGRWRAPDAAGRHRHHPRWAGVRAGRWPGPPGSPDSPGPRGRLASRDRPAGRGRPRAGRPGPSGHRARAATRRAGAGEGAAVREGLRYQFPPPSTSTCWVRSPPASW